MSRYSEIDKEMALLSGEKLPEKRELPDTWENDDSELDELEGLSTLLQRQAD